MGALQSDLPSGRQVDLPLLANAAALVENGKTDGMYWSRNVRAHQQPSSIIIKGDHHNHGKLAAYVQSPFPKMLGVLALCNLPLLFKLLALIIFQVRRMRQCRELAQKAG